MRRLSKMVKKIGWLAAVLSFTAVAGTPVALTSAQQQAIMDSGTAFGQGTLSVGAGTVNGTGGAAGVPSYNTTPSAASPGNLGLTGAATAKQAGCNGYTAPSGAGQVANQQDCSAVDFLTNNPNPAAAYPINPKTDPSIQAGTSVLTAAQNGTAFQSGGVAAGGASTTATGSAGVTGTTTQTGCQATITTTPALTTTATCYSAATEITQTCNKTLVITEFQTPGCSPGQYLVRVTADPCPACIDYLAYDFSCGAGTYLMHVSTVLKSNGAVNVDLGTQTVVGGLNVTVPETAGPSSMINGYCYTTDYSQTCSGASCSITVWFHNPCQGTSYSGVNTFVMPTTIGFTPSWNNQCSALQAAAQ